ncbi:MAG: hypothetical protein ABIL37_00860 [candidate division WOR-3 bacterium]
MIWIYLALLIIVLFFLFGYIRDLYTPKYAPSKEIIKKVNEILKNPINVAIELLKQELKISKITDKYYIYLQLAFLYSQIGKLDKAVRLARSLIVGVYVDENIKKKAIILVGELYLKLNKLKEGLDFLLDHKLEDKDYYFLIAKLYEHLKDYKNSAQYYRKIIHNLEKEQLSNILSKLSILSVRNGDFENSQRLITEASKVYEDGFVDLARGIYHFYKGNFEKAIEFIIIGLNKKPNLYGFVREELRELYFELGKVDDLLNYLKNHQNPIAKLDYIRILHNMGDYSGARDYFFENKDVFASNLVLISKVYQILKDESIIKYIIDNATKGDLYICRACNSKYSGFYIECPSCYRIGTFEVIHQRPEKLIDYISIVPESYIE